MVNLILLNLCDRIISDHIKQDPLYWYMLYHSINFLSWRPAETPGSGVVPLPRSEQVWAPLHPKSSRCWSSPSSWGWKWRTPPETRSGPVGTSPSRSASSPGRSWPDPDRLNSFWIFHFFQNSSSVKWGIFKCLINPTFGGPITPIRARFFAKWG